MPTLLTLAGVLGVAYASFGCSSGVLIARLFHITGTKYQALVSGKDLSQFLRAASESDEIKQRTWR